MERLESATLTLHIKTNKRTIYRVFNNYSELFDYGTLALSDMQDGLQMYTHTPSQWAKRGDHCHDFSNGEPPPAEDMSHVRAVYRSHTSEDDR